MSEHQQPGKHPGGVVASEVTIEQVIENLIDLGTRMGKPQELLLPAAMDVGTLADSIRTIAIQCALKRMRYIYEYKLESRYGHAHSFMFYPDSMRISQG